MQHINRLWPTLPGWAYVFFVALAFLVQFSDIARNRALILGVG